MSPWRATCTGCGDCVEPWLNRVRQGVRPRCGCTAKRQRAAAEKLGREKLEANAPLAMKRMLNLDWQPLEPYPGDRQPWRSRCLRCGEIGSPSVKGLSKFRGCKTCSGWGLITEEQAQATMQEAGWLPLKPFPGPRVPWLCECMTCGRRKTPNYETTKSRKSRCRDCAARANGERRRAAFADQAVETMRKALLEPMEPYPGAGAQWLCRCLRCDDMTRPMYSNIHAGGRGCETCRRRAQGAAKRDRYAEHCERLARRLGFTPLGPYPGMTRAWKCLCRCGRPTQIWAGALDGRPRGCRWCANYGFKFSNPSLVYLVLHPGLNALKIGVTAVGSTRLTIFEKHGWQVLAKEAVATGFKAVFVESSILSWWREELKLPPYLSEEDTPTGGWTETIEVGSVSTALVIERLGTLAAQARLSP